MKRSDFLKVTGLGALSPSLIGSQFATKDKPELIKPARLKKGDTIGFAAPASIVYDETEFERMEEVMKSFGLNVVFGKYVRQRYGYFAGTDYERASDVNQFFEDPDIKGIVAVRGGWGCARTLEHLDFEMIAKNPKVFCGFSDNTSLHLALNKHSNLVSFHGPVGTSDWTELTKESFKKVVMDGEAAVYKPFRGTETIYPGTTEGHLVGGNLSIFETSLATSYQPYVKGGILFLEDVDEPPYKIDRMLTHLKHAGILQEINGFVFGQCTDCEDDDASKNNFTIKQVLDHHIKPLKIPAAMGLDFGHDPGNITLPMGIPAKLNADTGTLKLTESAVI